VADHCTTRPGEATVRTITSPGGNGGKQMTIESALSDARTKMAKAIEVAKDDFGSIRTGRAHPSMFAKIQAEYYGSPTPLQQLATLQVPEARMILIQPFDPTAMAGIEKAIRESDLGVNPSNDGKVIRVVLPELTSERRKEYVKLARTKAEEAKVSVRAIRRTAKEAIEQLSKAGDVGEDEASRAEKQLDSLTKRNTDEVDELLKHKEAEILEV
jgi:ribosome recycling factor